jgi:hypothetical protein
MDAESVEALGLAPASLVRRVLGWLVDYLIVMIPGLTIVTFAVIDVVQSLPGYVGSVAAEVGWSRLIHLVTHHGAEVGGIRAAASDEWLNLAAPLIGALLLVPAFQFAYHAIFLTWRGRTVGKMLADARVGTTPSGKSRPSVRSALRRAFGTTLIETGILAVALVLVTVGQLTLGSIVWGAAVIAFWMNALSALGGRHRTVIDRVSGTVVVRSALYAQAAERTGEIVRRGSEAAVGASRATAQAAVTAGRATADAAAVAGQLAREGAEAFAKSAPVQQVLSSRAAQQAQAIGAAGADKARELSSQAAGRARLFGRKVREKYEERQAKRALPEASPERADDVG